MRYGEVSAKNTSYRVGRGGEETPIDKRRLGGGLKRSAALKSERAPPPSRRNYRRVRTAKVDGAGEGNRTPVFSLEGCCSTIELHPLLPIFSETWLSLLLNLKRSRQ